MEFINYTLIDGVGTLTLNRPHRKNAIDAGMREELKEVIFAMPQQRDLRVLIITGAGGAFCAGGDISGMQAGSLTAEEGRDRMRRDYLSWIETLIRLEIPVIAAVQGPAFGAGVQSCPDCGYDPGRTRQQILPVIHEAGADP